MKNITIIIFLFVFVFPFNLRANTFSLSATCTGGELTINRHNLTSGKSEVVNQGHACAGLDTPHMVDPINGLFIIEQSGVNDTLAYDYTNNTITNLSGSSGVPRYVIPYTNTAVSDMITINTTDNSIHIGENSLVTLESGGRQQLYATDATGNRIDINIPSGTNLLIDGEDVMGSIDSSIALGAAFASLPTGAEGASYTCGLGTGFHDSASAISGGCGFDFANYSFVDTMPELFQKASFNIGAASVVHGEGDDATLKAGITFKFGAPKPVREAKDNNLLLENKIDAVMAENDSLKAQIAEINTQLKALNMLAMN